MDQTQVSSLSSKQINEVTDLVNQNLDQPRVLNFLQPVLRSVFTMDGPEAETYLKNLRKSPAGTRIKELALTGNLKQRFAVSHIALALFDDEEV